MRPPCLSLLSCRVLTTLAVAILVAGVGGCRRPRDPSGAQAVPDAEAKAKSQPSRMRVVVVDDSPFAAVLERQWKARIDNELQLQQMSLEELEAAKQLNADVIFYPSACLGVLVERNLISLPSAEVWEDAQYAARDVFELQRRVEGQWGEQLYAFSFGSPQLVLMYRADVLEALKLSIPQTWAEYGELLPQLARDQVGLSVPADGRPWSAAIEPLGQGWGAKILLARAAAYASHPSQFSTLFDYETMQPLIAGPPFERALDELVAAAKLGPENLQQQTPETARRALLAGEAAIVLTWPSRAQSGGKALPIAEGVRIGFAELPGSRTVFDFAEKTWTPQLAGEAPTRVPLLGTAGRLASVAKNARRPREAAGILALLSGREWSARISPASPAATMFRQSHLKNSDLWTDEGLPREASDGYGEVVRTSQTRPNFMFCLRIPGWQRYLSALDQAVQEARTGTKTSAAALAGAVEAWHAITQELGLESQKSAYTRSLGLEP
ncbi:MAG: extracellular solute-binding protein [Pirellulaceae bacterium]